ncbi:Short-chain dehydrogenase/reductase SDR [Nitrospina gracilis 3/211]|uniref:Short-chain dehydrogenase/reductase SDR n=1 Tax=Nitrospina gracilis (strain 3/211) TaxID=1266370 RepID=M1Z0I3_NITG3|nr:MULTISPECIES: SDR family oxidoreductase [Nitrospina]MCF8723910.1 NAD(P)-dependent dehydrogenase (short-subunit alcohol dehydrogenase family) [Nitrospina sp. Nb-3]CCQ91032.1 Short-chain dehydrogenase/reductase SDR [Nitrospina gracilis 3/211]
MISNSMKNRTCLITGANSGIGYETARALGYMGAKLILVCRNPDKGQAALDSLRMRTGNDDMELMIADLASLHQVEELAEKVRARHNVLHVLINNAGLLQGRRELTEDGYETTFAVNHLAHYVLTLRLLDLLKAGSPSRIINVSSIVHLIGSIRFDDPFFEKKSYRAMSAYAQSKLANILFTYKLARLLEGSGITVNAMHPGVVATNFGHAGPLWYKLAKVFARPFYIRPQNGARTLIHLAASPQVENVTGTYFVRKRSVPTLPVSYDTSLQDRLWDISGQMTGVRWHNG